MQNEAPATGHVDNIGGRQEGSQSADVSPSKSDTSTVLISVFLRTRRDDLWIMTETLQRHLYVPPSPMSTNITHKVASTYPRLNGLFKPVNQRNTRPNPSARSHPRIWCVDRTLLNNLKSINPGAPRNLNSAVLKLFFHISVLGVRVFNVGERG